MSIRYNNNPNPDTVIYNGNYPEIIEYNGDVIWKKIQNVSAELGQSGSNRIITITNNAAFSIYLTSPLYVGTTTIREAVYPSSPVSVDVAAGYGTHYEVDRVWGMGNISGFNISNIRNIDPNSITVEEIPDPSTTSTSSMIHISFTILDTSKLAQFYLQSYRNTYVQTYLTLQSTTIASGSSTTATLRYDYSGSTHIALTSDNWSWIPTTDFICNAATDSDVCVNNGYVITH